MVRAWAIGKDGLLFSENTFFEEKVAFVLLKWHWQEKNIGREVFFASKYRKGIDLQQPFPISDL